MTRLTMLGSYCAAACLAAACSNDVTQPADAAVPDLAATVDLTPALPAPPVLGQQIDRMGRAGTNLLLNDPFYLADPTSDGTMSPMQDTHRNLYNADGNEALWQQNWIPIFEASLSIYDAFDAKCGNQLFAGLDADAGSTRYSMLAITLADDQLYLDGTHADCDVATNYLAVESRASGGAVAGCGGRTPLDRVIDVTYTALAEGSDAAPPVVNGIAADADPATPASLTTFPFLNAPNP